MEFILKIFCSFLVSYSGESKKFSGSFKGEKKKEQKSHEMRINSIYEYESKNKILRKTS
jgi:hypothetical protein